MTRIETGQIYRDEEGLKWRVVGFCGNGWPAVKPTTNKNCASIMTNPAWFSKWTLVA